MTTKEAITTLRSMQAQIIHGKRTFGDIADLLVTLQSVRKSADRANCECTPRERDSGHLVDCWMPELEAALAMADEVDPPNNDSTTVIP